jgi:hypothetical protein
VNGSDQALDLAVFIFQGGPAGKLLLPIGFHSTFPGWKTLLF